MLNILFKNFFWFNLYELIEKENFLWYIRFGLVIDRVNRFVIFCNFFFDLKLWCNVYFFLFCLWNWWKKLKNGFLLKNEILLELFRFGLFFGIILYFGFNEIEWIEIVFCKYVMILNKWIIFLFFDCWIKERCFFNNFCFLVDFLVGFEFRWSFDYLLEKKEWMDFVVFLRNFFIFFGNRWLIIGFLCFVNSWDIEEYLERFFGNWFDFIFFCFVWRKEGF